MKPRIGLLQANVDALIKARNKAIEHGQSNRIATLDREIAQLQNRIKNHSN